MKILKAMDNHAGALCATLFFAAPLGAQERISPELFLDMVAGKTVTFLLPGTGELHGVEEFLSRRQTVWRKQGDGCVYGDVTIEDEKLCFRYDAFSDGLPVCWWVFRDGDTILMRSDDFINADIIELGNVSDESLSCPVVPIA